MFGLSKREESSSGEREGGTLLLYISSLGWWSQLLDQRGEMVWQRESAGLPPVDVAPGDEISRMVQLVLEGHKSGEWKQVGEIVLLLESGKEVVIEDKAKIFRGATAGVLRQIGRQQINSAEVCYGFRAFGSDANGESWGVYSFGDATRLRRYLALLDQQATKITQLVPVSAVLIGQALLQKRENYGALLMGAESTLCFLVNRNKGVVVSRTLPVGVVTLARTLAEKMSVSPHEALDALRQRDHISSIPSSRDEQRGVAAGMVEQGLAPPLQKLMEELRDTVSFFSEQRLGGEIDSLELLGGFSSIKGLAEWVGKSSTVAPSGDSFFALFIRAYQQSGKGGCMNLLQGAENGLVTVGKVRYVLHEGRLKPER
ncbi:MAG: hypothetical protein HN842_09230, partial [Gammaproteobacteria bacterium]|nr:hypothetical protein [Gammaproteobacteria bacterium]